MLKKQGAESDYLNEDFKQVSTSVAFTSMKTSNQKKGPLLVQTGRWIRCTRTLPSNIFFIISMYHNLFVQAAFVWLVSRR